MQETTVTDAIHVPDIINGKKVGAFQYLIAFLCGLVMFLDGFDTQAISYMAPLIAREWNLSREMLGLIFSSALTGLMVGYLVLSPLSDRFGHRRILLVSTVTFALFTLATVFAGSATGVIALRFLAGVGLGAAIPSAVALTSEYTPKRLRASFVLAIYCGFSLGFVAAGVAAALLLPIYGWRSLLWIGALAPLVLAVVLFLRLPESLEFLVRNGADHNRIWTLLRRVDPGLTKPAEAAGFTTDQEDKRSAVRGIFQSGRGAGTLLLWLVFIINLAEFYALQSWLPTILTSLNYSISTIALATSLTTTGGIVGIGGPWLFGMLFGWHLTPASAFYMASIPLLLAAAAVMFMGWLYRTR